MSPFAPVHLAQPLDDRGSQTFLRHYSLCPRSGFLYAKYRGEASTAAMQRGTAFHEIAARATKAMLENEEPVIPWELVKVIANEVLAEIPVPVEEHDYIRECAWRWASSWTIDPSALVIARETMFVLDIDGFQVRVRVDFGALLEDGAACHIVDYKTARSAPAMDEVARTRPDGTLAAKSFQLVLYALAVAFGVPVRVETCDRCGGAGTLWRAHNSPERCGVCVGSGRLEILEPFGLADRANRFDLEFAYPGIKDREDRMLRRTMSLSRPELDEYRESLRGLIARLRRSEQAGDWPAVVSDEACSICPSPQECPIPRELRDHRGEIQSAEQAAEAAQVLDRINAEAAAVRKEIKAWCKANDVALRYGNRVWEFVPKSSERISNREAMFEAMDRAVMFGDPFERERFVTVSQGTDFRARDLTEDEKAEGSR